MTVNKVRGIPLVILVFFSVVLTACFCAHVPKSSSLPSRSSFSLATAANGLDRAVKVRKRDLLQQDEDNEENAARVVIPMVISKRSATALGKLMHLLRTSMDNTGGRIPNSSTSRERESFPIYSANFEMFNLQRRNQKSNYLRCYFNAVSCF